MTTWIVDLRDDVAVPAAALSVLRKADVVALTPLAERRLAVSGMQARFPDEGVTRNALETIGRRNVARAHVVEDALNQLLAPLTLEPLATLGHHHGPAKVGAAVTLALRRWRIDAVALRTAFLGHILNTATGHVRWLRVVGRTDHAQRTLQAHAKANGALWDLAGEIVAPYQGWQTWTVQGERPATKIRRPQGCRGVQLLAGTVSRSRALGFGPAVRALRWKLHPLCAMCCAEGDVPKAAVALGPAEELQVRASMRRIPLLSVSQLCRRHKQTVRGIDARSAVETVEGHPELASGWDRGPVISDDRWRVIVQEAVVAEVREQYGRVVGLWAAGASLGRKLATRGAWLETGPLETAASRAFVAGCREGGGRVRIVQHGGGYGVWHQPLLDEAELRFATEFVAWGPGVEAQTRETRDVPVVVENRHIALERAVGEQPAVVGERVIYAPTGISGARYYIPGFVQPDGQFFRQMLRTHGALSHLEDIEYVLKLHGSNEEIDSLRLGDVPLARSRIVRCRPLNVLLRCGDVLVIDHPTTTLVQGLAAGCDIIYINSGWVQHVAGALETLRRGITIIDADHREWPDQLQEAVRRRTERANREWVARRRWLLTHYAGEPASGPLLD